MICTEVTLLTPTITKNSIGVEGKNYTPFVVPIIKVEDVYSNEFYEASQIGLKAELRLRISALNYNGERELVYNNEGYSVIRTSTPHIDEVVLICERKINDKLKDAVNE